MGQDSSASASGLLGLDGFGVTAAEVIDGEWRLAVQTIAATVGCAACGRQARLHGRRTVQVGSWLFAMKRGPVCCWQRCRSL